MTTTQQRPNPISIPKATPGARPVSPEIFQNELQTLLQGLLGRNVTAKKPGPKAGAGLPIMRGTYSADDGKVRAICTCDLGLAAYAGAALGLFPVGAAADAIAARQLPEMLLENFREVLNVCARMWNEHSPEHVSLSEVTMEAGPDGPKGASREFFEFEVTIAGYGAGRISFRRV